MPSLLDYLFKKKAKKKEKKKPKLGSGMLKKTGNAISKRRKMLDEAMKDG